MFAPIPRHDGWTPDRTARFLETLSHKGNVRAASAAAGLSREAAYRRRRRDPLFARGWAAAAVLAREESAQVLADRALDGVEEEVWFRGEVVGTRTRYDNRLLLAHIARLDRVADSDAAQADAARFDELVACLAAANDDLPPDRVTAIEQAAQAEADRQEEEEAGGFGEDEWERERRVAAERIDRARTDAAHAWDARQADACAQIDTLLQILPEPAAPAAASTLSTMSTSHPILSGTGRGTAAAGGDEGAPAASPDVAETDPSTVSTVSTSPEPDPARPGSPAPTPLVLSPSKDAGTPPTTLPGNRAERRRRGRKHRPAVPHPMTGRQAHPPLQAAR